MEISKSLVPNCSEFVFYINLTESSKGARRYLKNVIRDLESGDKKVLEDYGLYEVPRIEQDKVFGIDCYRISGETSDHGSKLGEEINLTGVVFERRQGY